MFAFLVAALFLIPQVFSELLSGIFSTIGSFAVPAAITVANYTFPVVERGLRLVA